MIFSRTYADRIMPMALVAAIHAVLASGCSLAGDPRITCTAKIHLWLNAESRRWYLEHQDVHRQNGVVDGVILEAYRDPAKVLVFVDPCDSRNPTAWYCVFDDSTTPVGPLDESVFQLDKVKKSMSRIDLTIR
jgi:hypothetical protein